MSASGLLITGAAGRAGRAEPANGAKPGGGAGAVGAPGYGAIAGRRVGADRTGAGGLVCGCLRSGSPADHAGSWRCGSAAGWCPGPAAAGCAWLGPREPGVALAGSG